MGSECFFTQGLVVLDDCISLCSEEFGIEHSKVVVGANAEYSNVYYGGDSPSGTRVMWPNGDVDPWHGLSVQAPRRTPMCPALLLCLPIKALPLPPRDDSSHVLRFSIRNMFKQIHVGTR